VEHLTRPELQGFFIHVDADCLDDAVMPAVEYRLSDGLTPRELQRTLQIALASGKAVGIEVTVYNPKLDAEGAAGRGLVDVLADALLAKAGATHN
jgi:arginase